MSDQTIDERIVSMLSTVAGRWRKIAMVITMVADAMSDDLPLGDDGYRQVAQRIEALVNEGRLVAQGDIKNWRFSEVRLPS
jgi:Protein of unknown function